MVDTYDVHPDEPHTLEWDVDLSSMEPSQATVRLIVERPNVGMMFRGQFNKQGTKATVSLPPFSSYVNENEREVEAKLEIIGRGFYFLPWTGTIRFKQPPKAQAAIRQQHSLSEDTPHGPDISATLSRQYDQQPSKDLSRQPPKQNSRNVSPSPIPEKENPEKDIFQQFNDGDIGLDEFVEMSDEETRDMMDILSRKFD